MFELWKVEVPGENHCSGLTAAHTYTQQERHRQTRTRTQITGKASPTRGLASPQAESAA